MMLTHLFSDVEHKYVNTFGLLSGVINTPSPLWDLEYADETAFLWNSAEQITRLLHLIQLEEFKRGLILNEDKCEHLRLTLRPVYIMLRPLIENHVRVRYVRELPNPLIKYLSPLKLNTWVFFRQLLAPVKMSAIGSHRQRMLLSH